MDYSKHITVSQRVSGLIDEIFATNAEFARIFILLSLKVGIYFGRLSHKVEVRLEGGWDLLTSPIRRSMTSSNNASASSDTWLNS